MNDLIKIATKKFENLTRIETRLLETIPNAESVSCLDSSVPFDRTKPENIPDYLTIRSDLLIWLCGENNIRKHITKYGIILNDAKIEGELLLDYMEIPFDLRFNNCSFPKLFSISKSKLRSLELNKCFIHKIWGVFAELDGSLVINQSMVKNGARFENAFIKERVDCANSLFIPSNLDKDYVSLSFTSAHVKDRLLLDKGFESYGQVKLVNCKIGQDLDCSGARIFINPNYGSIGLNCNNLIVNGDVNLSNDFRSLGECRFIETEIGGSLLIVNSILLPVNFMKNAYCFVLDRSSIKRYVLIKGTTLCDNFHMIGTKVFGDLNFESLKFIENGKSAHEIMEYAYECKIESSLKNSIDILNSAVIAQYNTVFGRFIWQKINGINTVFLDLTNSKVNTYIDDKKSWPLKDKLVINGFEYDRIASNSPTEAEDRMDWLNRQGSNFLVQPYEYLSAYYRKIGLNKEADIIAVGKQNQLVKHGNLSFSSKVIKHILNLTIGYGYKSYRSIFWLLGLLLISSFLFYLASIKGVITLAQNDGSIFHPIIYSLDTLIPVINFQYSKNWIVSPESVFYIYYIFHIVCGWLFSTMAIIGFSGLIKKD